MDPIIDNDWLINKAEPIDDSQTGNITCSWVWRERGLNPPNSPSNKTVLENVAEDILVQKPLKIRVSVKKNEYYFNIIKALLCQL